jgi:hypothetical protein
LAWLFEPGLAVYFDSDQLQGTSFSEAVGICAAWSADFLSLFRSGNSFGRQIASSAGGLGGYIPERNSAVEESG